TAARYRHHRRPDCESDAHAVHDAGRVPLLRSAAALARAATANRVAAGTAAGGSVMPRVAAAFIAVVFTAGCMVGPTYHRPPIAGTPAFKEAPPAGWKNAEPNEGLTRGRWWEIYEDPQLNDLVSKVELSNQNVIAAMARYRDAVDQVQIARAALFPTVTNTPSVILTRGSSLSSRGQLISGSSGGTSSSGSTSRRGSGVNVNYAMPFDIAYQADVWGNIRRSVTASKESARAAG